MRDLFLYGLIGLCSLLLVTTIYFYVISSREPKNVKQEFVSDDVVTWLLEDGVKLAWIDNYDADTKMDCFVDNVRPEDGVSIFSYCKIRNQP